MQEQRKTKIVATDRGIEHLKIYAERTVTGDGKIFANLASRQPKPDLIQLDIVIDEIVDLPLVFRDRWPWANKSVEAETQEFFANTFFTHVAVDPIMTACRRFSRFTRQPLGPFL